MQIDPRGPRFGAFITATVLAVVLVTGSVWLLAAQALVFAAGAAFGLRYAPYGWLYRRLVRPRLGPPAALEPEAPPRFLPRRPAWPSRPSAWRATRQA
jgi:Domain of unknown function (DUF4395)